MAKTYTRKNWAGFPSKTTPLSSDNLNHMDKGIDDLDTKVSNMESMVSALGADMTDAKSDIVQLNDSLGDLQFRIEDGKPQWKPESAGADSWAFFSSGLNKYCFEQYAYDDVLNVEFLNTLLKNAPSTKCNLYHNYVFTTPPQTSSAHSDSILIKGLKNVESLTFVIGAQTNSTSFWYPTSTKLQYSFDDTNWTDICAVNQTNVTTERQAEGTFVNSNHNDSLYIRSEIILSSSRQDAGMPINARLNWFYVQYSNLPG